MKKLHYHFSSEKGITLIEILASIVILSIIILSLLSMFTQSSTTNNVSQNIIDATYIAENSMEEINNAVSQAVTTETSSTNFLKSFNLPAVYTKKNTDGSIYEKRTGTNGRYVSVTFEPKDSTLISVQVKVFSNDSSSKKLEAHMEMVLSWGK